MESAYRRKLIKRIESRLPGCFITLLDPTIVQGIPDVLVLYQDRWAALEVKESHDAPHQPNQDYYVDKFNSMSFSAFIYPENEHEVLDALQSAFGVEGPPRLFEP